MADGILDPFLAEPREAGLFLDYDGTLAEIVQDPARALPSEGVPQLLETLAGRFRLVAIVSGRSAHELVGWLGHGVEIWGVHGAQRAIGGEVQFSDKAVPYRDLIAEVRRDADEAVAALGIPGVLVEDKGVMVTLHYRAAADTGRARAVVEQIASDLAARHDLLQTEGRMAYELRPPVEFTKAAVVLERAREESLRAALFIGDDTVDLPAFDALDVLGREDVVTIRVAVSSAEAPKILLERADLVVDGPEGTVRLLKSLLG